MTGVRAIKFWVIVNGVKKWGQQRICHSSPFPGAVVPLMPAANNGNVSGQTTRSTPQWCQQRFIIRLILYHDGEIRVEKLGLPFLIVDK